MQLIRYQSSTKTACRTKPVSNPSSTAFRRTTRQQQQTLNQLQARQEKVAQQLAESGFLNVFDLEPQSTLQRIQDFMRQYQQLQQQNRTA